MTTRKFSTCAADAGQSLVNWLAARLQLDAAQARRVIESGAVYVDNKRASDPDTPLAAGQKIAVREGLDSDVPPLDILLETEDIVAVDKPAGVPSQATRDSIAAADRWVIERFPEARLVHRLDRDTRGVLLFSRGKQAHAKLARWMDEGAIERIYTAVVWGVPSPASGVIDRPVGPDPGDRRRQTAGLGKPARTEYATEAVGRSADGHEISRLSVRLVSGRTHQVRVHLASLRHPVCGDRLYCSLDSVDDVPEMALWAKRLSWPTGAVDSRCVLNIPILDDVLT